MWKLGAVCSIHVIGDWGRRGQFFQRHVAAKMDEIAYDAIISVGDNFYPDGIESSTDSQIKESWSDIYNTNKPWYVALGNHDHHGNAKAQTQIDLPWWNMPAPVFDVTVCGHTFVIMDSTTIDGSQWAHVDHLLEKSTNTYKWIVAHHPIYSAGWHHNVKDDYRYKMIEMYKKHNVIAILSGHDHNLQYIEYENIRQIISGSGSSAYFVQTKQDGLEFFKPEAGFVNLAISDNNVQLTYIGVNGTLFTKTILFKIV